MSKKVYVIVTSVIVVLGIIGGSLAYVSTNNSNKHETAIAKHSSSKNSSSKKSSNSSSTKSVESSVSTSVESSISAIDTGNNNNASDTDDTTASSSSTDVSEDTNTLSGFINTYGVTPAVWLVQNKGMSPQDALAATPDNMETSGEIQTEYSGAQSY